MKKIILPIGKMREKWVDEDEVRNIQKELHLFCHTWSANDMRILDAILSYFVLNVMKDPHTEGKNGPY